MMVRPRSHATGENPFSRLQVADIGDVVASLYNVQVGVTVNCAGGDIVPACCRRPAPPSRSSTPPSSPAGACRSPWAGTTSSPTPSSGQQPPHTAPSRSEEYIHLCRASNEGFTITEKDPPRAFSKLRVPTSGFTFKNPLRHYPKQVLTHG